MFGAAADASASKRMIAVARDNGVNFIDTANMYEGYSRVLGSAGGVAEEILGKALAGRRQGAYPGGNAREFIGL